MEHWPCGGYMEHSPSVRYRPQVNEIYQDFARLREVLLLEGKEGVERFKFKTKRVKFVPSPSFPKNYIPSGRGSNNPLISLVFSSI